MKVKTALQFKTPRMRFIGLECFLGMLFLLGYSVIDALFLQGYSGVRQFIDPALYIVYMLSMFALFVVLGAMFFCGGMYFQNYLLNRATKKMLDEIAENPMTALEMLQEQIGGLKQ